MGNIQYKSELVSNNISYTEPIVFYYEDEEGNNVKIGNLECEDNAVDKILSALQESYHCEIRFTQESAWNYWETISQHI